MGSAVLVVAFLTSGVIITLAAEGLGAGEGECNLTSVNLCVELNVLSEFNVESIAAEESLEYSGEGISVHTEVYVLVELEVYIILVDLKVDNIDIKHLAAE